MTSDKIERPPVTTSTGTDEGDDVAETRNPDAIAKEIEQTGKRTVLLGAIYAALDRLEGNGLVTSTYGDPTPERGGRAKRFFKVSHKLAEHAAL